MTKFVDLTPSLGTEILDLDLGQDLDDATIATLQRLLALRGLLVFRDQSKLSPDRHVEVSRRFGGLEVHVQKRYHHAAHPEILIVSNVIENGTPIGLADAGKYWHSDLSYLAEPSLGSLLHAQELPKDGSGDTIFTDMRAAYDALDDETKQKLIGLTAEHSYVARNKAQAAVNPDRKIDAATAATVPPVNHPVVRAHPVTGRAALFVSEGFTTRINELDDGESRSLLDRLFAHSVEPRFHYRHKWRDHDLVFWDNRSTMHLATGCPASERRTLYRTTVRGDRPIAYAASGREAAA
ncbi:TauD/TfdA dioxygenase family protein [Roseiterribacter gracilis]|uniref:Taurine dioxygenase n=1 Tax=Roseiterribacter gracilis TaxID=2812848 RepID=A0A8S8XA99_9PROT|nr:taurine dioxygenase [Rhodospirillales bacterium TMPK1]